MSLNENDKKEYRESKKRRKQALESYETGKIKPIKDNKKILIIALATVLVIIAALAVIFTVMNSSSQKQADTFKYGQSLNLSERSKQLLQIVNRKDKLEKDYVPSLTDFNGFKVNSSMKDDIAKMFKKAEGDKITLKINSAYVTFDEQQKLYEKTLAEINKQGSYSKVRAAAKAARITPEGGCSEAQLGLLVDFDVSDAKTKAFLEREGINYGFILRYPKESVNTSHMDASDSLYRYVGVENAQKMRSLNMCLEDFVNYNNLTS